MRLAWSQIQSYTPTPHSFTIILYAMTGQLQLPSVEHQVQILGEVLIAPSATIAPNVLLQAHPGCRIIIGEWVCIGSGTILHAHKGMIELESGCSLGRKVLLFGVVKVGADACIGTGTTILNSNVDPFQVIPAHTLLGDIGQPLSPEAQAEQEVIGRVNPSTPITFPPHHLGDNPTPISPAINQPTPNSVPPTPTETVTLVYGRTQVAHLMKTLFPHHHTPGDP